MVSAQQNLDELSNAAQVALLQALQALAGAEAMMQHERILVKLASINTVRARVLEVSASDESAVVQVAIQVSGKSTGRDGIIDILAGIERNTHEAILSAIRKWIRFTFPPIRAALSPAEDLSRHLGVTQLVERPDLQWQIISGNALVIGHPTDQASVQNALKSASLFPGIAGDPVAARLNGAERRYHWLKLFAAWSNGEVVVECQFDNDEWTELDTLIAAQFRFPTLVGEFVSIKQFVVIRPD